MQGTPSPLPETGHSSIGSKANVPPPASTSNPLPQVRKPVAHRADAPDHRERRRCRCQHIILVQATVVCAEQVWGAALPSACATPGLILAVG